MVERDALVEPVEPHVLQVVAHDRRARDAAVVVQRLLDNVAVLREHVALVRVAFKVVDRVEDVVAQVPLVEVDVTLCIGLGRFVVEAVCHVADEAGRAINDGTEAVSELRDDGVQVDAVEHVADHQHEVGQAGLEVHFRSDVLDQERDFVDGQVHACVEFQQLEDLRIQVYFGREVVDADEDLAYMYGGIEEDIGLGNEGRDVVGGVGGFEDYGSWVAVVSDVQFIVCVAILADCKERKRKERDGRKY